ncbi:MAG: DUF998 domain-containing protein [Deltaproteobacteria bacterium]|nr:DUF998 domain-containing protein [Deltaproteobacteria bacterium]
MNERLKSENALVFSYLTLRKAIGLLGTSFPFVLLLGGVIFFQTEIQNSISSYYHTGMGDVFVGTLCVIGFFLLSYKGYERADDIAGDWGCIFAVGMALFPTTPDNPASGDARFIGYIHFAFAALFFLTLIYFSLFLFTKTDQSRPPTKRKLQRNKVYKVCGYTMSLCIAIIFIYYLLPDKAVLHIEVYKPVFWLEAIAVVAFGISWLTKGEAILKDEA